MNILEGPIQATLCANYCGTERLLEISQRCHHLALFVYISSSFANINCPMYSTVEEKIYPLMNGDHVVGIVER